MNNSTRAICCVVTEDYIPGLIALYASVLKHQTVPLYLLVVDIEPNDVPPLSKKLSGMFQQPVADLIHLVTPIEIYGEAVHQMRFYYDAFEFATAAKAGIHIWMQEHTEVESWLYIDTDIICFGSLDPLFEQLNSASVLLTPHIAHPAARIEEDLQYLSAGAFNGGVVGVRKSIESARFAHWYKNVLEFNCLNDPPLPAAERFTQSTVLFVDQRWLDLVPAYFPCARIASDRGFNVGHWNVGDDRLNLQENILCIGNDPVILLHLSGIIEDDTTRLSKHSSVNWSGSSLWSHIHSDYVKTVGSYKKDFPANYRFGKYPDGSAIPKSHRRVYLKHILSGGQRYDNPLNHKADFQRPCTPRITPMPYRWS